MSGSSPYRDSDLEPARLGRISALEEQVAELEKQKGALRDRVAYLEQFEPLMRKAETAHTRAEAADAAAWRSRTELEDARKENLRLKKEEASRVASGGGRGAAKVALDLRTENEDLKRAVESLRGEAVLVARELEKTKRDAAHLEEELARVNALRR